MKKATKREMSLETAMRLLQGGPVGIKRWNRLRRLGVKIPTLRYQRIGRADLSGADLSGATLTNANLTGATLSGADLSSADLTGAQLEGANLNKANLTAADLLYIAVDSSTLLEGSSVLNCGIDRYTLESLNNYGGLSRADLMTMDIEDGLARLRSSFSGFLQYLHLAALVLFVFPYVSFVLRHWTAAKFGLGDEEKTITLFEALLRYIVGGGAGWREGWSLSWTFGLFLFSLTYNIARAVLLWKTKSLELAQEARGLPVSFSLTGSWHGVYQVARIGFWVNLGVVLLHTVHFLWQRIPL